VFLLVRLMEHKEHNMVYQNRVKLIYILLCV